MRPATRRPAAFCPCLHPKLTCPTEYWYKIPVGVPMPYSEAGTSILKTIKHYNMKKSIILDISAVFVLLSACQPVEIRQELKGGITESQLNISAVPQIRDGKKSNYIDLNSDGNACLSSWDFGVGLFVGTKGTVKVMMKGPNDIIFNGLNADGTMITKTLTVQVDELYDV